ncbi:MAG: hypothetical protein N2053_13205, partial [Chitinispirillaceae bacterium]|nr:hypothetical protein [Chitinispirillaceae bacterium]
FYDVGDSARAYRSEISIKKEGPEIAEFTFTFTMNAHNLEAGEGYCYQFRPIKILPVRIDPATVVISSNDGHKAEITDNLVIWEMLAKGETLRKGESKKLKWTAKIIDDGTRVKDKTKDRKDNHISYNFKYTYTISKDVITIQILEHIKAFTVYDLSGREIYIKKFKSPYIGYLTLPLTTKNSKILCFEREDGLKYYRTVY